MEETTHNIVRLIEGGTPDTFIKHRCSNINYIRNTLLEIPYCWSFGKVEQEYPNWSPIAVDTTNNVNIIQSVKYNVESENLVMFSEKTAKVLITIN